MKTYRMIRVIRVVEAYHVLATSEEQALDATPELHSISTIEREIEDVHIENKPRYTD